MSDHNNIFEASNIINEHLTHNYERVEHSYDEDDKCLLDNAVERLLLEFQSLKIKVKKSENPHRTLTPAERTNNKEYENQEKTSKSTKNRLPPPPWRCYSGPGGVLGAIFDDFR